MRNAFIRKLDGYAKDKRGFVILSSDLGYTIFDEFRINYPDKFFNVGIAENNMIGLASGLSLGGKKVFVYAISTFLAYKCIEQIRNDVCHPLRPIVIVGVGSGFSYGNTGFTHHATEDIGCLKSLPNLTILSPSDPIELEDFIDQSFEYDRPIYMRLGRSGEKSFTQHGAKIGRARFVYKEEDVALVTHGNIIDEVVKARLKLKEKGLSVSLISSPCLKPLDDDFFRDLFDSHKHVFVIEEHNKIGGLGEMLWEFGWVNRIAVDDCYFDECGDSAYLRKISGIDMESICSKVLERINA